MRTNLYIALIVMGDPDSKELTGSAKPVLAVNAEAALQETLEELHALAPETAGLEIKVQDVREIPREFLEQAAREVLGWDSPEA